MLRVNATGTVIFSETYGEMDADIGVGVTQTASGRVLIAGYTYSYGAGSADGWPVRVAVNGSKLADRTDGTSGDDFLLDITTTADGSRPPASVTSSNPTVRPGC